MKKFVNWECSFRVENTSSVPLKHERHCYVFCSQFSLSYIESVEGSNMCYGKQTDLFAQLFFSEVMTGPRTYFLSKYWRIETSYLLIICWDVDINDAEKVRSLRTILHLLRVFKTLLKTNPDCLFIYLFIYLFFI